MKKRIAFAVLFMAVAVGAAVKNHHQLGNGPEPVPVCPIENCG
jgi:hypothetical protein